MRAPIDSAIGREKLWKSAAQLVPRRHAARFNSALVDLGALVCLPDKPKCNVCPVKKFCRAKNPEALPTRKSKSRTKRLIERHALVVSNGKILLEQSSARWRGMWILPRLETRAKTDPPVHTSIFPFTHHQVKFVVCYGQAPKKLPPNQRWFKSIGRVAMPSPHRRAVQTLFNKLHVRDRQSLLATRCMTGRMTN
jgi:A/G-specific adenine glycosylase